MSSKNPSYSSSNIHYLLKRYNEMLRSRRQYFFDVHEFESIVDYFTFEFNFNRALEAVELGVKQHPSSTTIKLKKAQVLVESANPDKGLLLLKELEKIEYLNPELYFIKGQAYAFKGFIKKALGYFNQAVIVSPNTDVQLLADIALCLQQLNYYSESIDFLLRAHEEEPANINILYDLAHSYELTGSYNASAAFYHKYLDEEPYSPHIWHNLGLVYAHMEHFDKAVDAYDFVLAIDEEYTSAIFNKAHALASSGKFSAAINVYKEFLGFEPENAHALCFLAECYEKLQDFNNALKYYDHVIFTDKNYAEGWFGYGYILKLTGKVKESIPYFEQAILLDEKNTEYLYLLSESYFQVKKFNSAKNILKKLVELDPHDFEAWLLYSQIYFNNKELEKAILILKNSGSGLHDSAPINFRLAAYYFAINDFEAAKNHFKLGIHYSKDSEDINQILEFYPQILKDQELKEYIKIN